MRTRRSLTAAGLALLLVAGVAAAQEKPKPEITFSVAGDEFTARQAVPFTGTITPATPEQVTINVQKWNNTTEAWRFFDSNKVMSEVKDADTTRFSFTHDPLPKGKYRARAVVKETDDHLAGKNRWKNWRVITKRHR